MVAIVLYKPEIPPNTGNIMRLCANNGFSLHLIRPLGFELSDKLLHRARMDYNSNIDPKIYNSFDIFLNGIKEHNLLVISKFGKKNYTRAKFSSDSILLFGSETAGLPENIIKKYSSKLYRIPMIENSRSLNLSNAVAVVSYEAWKQLEFSGATN